MLLDAPHSIKVFSVESNSAPDVKERAQRHAQSYA